MALESAKFESAEGAGKLLVQPLRAGTFKPAESRHGRDTERTLLRGRLGLRGETPDEVLRPLLGSLSLGARPKAGQVRAIARDCGAAGWLRTGVTLGELAQRFGELWDARGNANEAL
jgi:hypothetical protein